MVSTPLRRGGRCPVCVDTEFRLGGSPLTGRGLDLYPFLTVSKTKEEEDVGSEGEEKDYL